ncbi:MAG TPA: hypothetical protein VFP89_08645 [Propionibacteriaceae bacterium]|nr:hypothetical protein [Propionibacteriaceae bacterium]
MADLELITARGWQVLRLTTDQIAVDIVPGLGGTIVSLRRRSDDLELLWRSPWGLRPPGSPAVPGTSDALMMDTFVGGWQTLFPNGGDSATTSGVEWGQDGEARIAPFEWERTGDTLTMTTRLVRSPFEITKIVSVEAARVRVEESIRNVGGETLETMWGQQVIFGPPLLSPDTVVDAAAALVHPDPITASGAGYHDITPWPRTPGPYSMINLRTLPAADAYELRQAYLTEFRRPWASVSNARLDLAVDLEWNSQTWPYLWYALEAGRQEGFPWFSRGYFFSLTPSTSWPAHGLHDARSVSSTTLWVAPDLEVTSQLTLTLRPAGGTRG